MTEDYSTTYPYWCARLATGVALAVVDMRQKHDYLARRHLEVLLREFLASGVPSDELKRGLRQDLKQR